MSQKFNGSVQHRGDASYVKLGGIIDEDNELSELIDKIPNGTAIIDLGEIERINSCGVRDWVNWLSKLEVNGTRSVLIECSPAIVAQINLVNNFTGSGVVKSFYVPYFCPECDEEKVLLVEAADMGPPPHEPPTCRCDECDLVMDFDDMPDSYFAFLSNQKKVGDRESLARDVGPAEPTNGARSKVRSRASLPSIAQSSANAAAIVPSLPSIQRSGQSSASHAAAVAAVNAKAASRPPLGAAGGAAPYRMSGTSGSRPPLGAGAPMFSPMTSPSSPTMLASPVGQPARSNGLVIALILVLIAAIGILVYLVATK